MRFLQYLQNLMKELSFADIIHANTLPEITKTQSLKSTTGIIGIYLVLPLILGVQMTFFCTNSTKI